MTEIDDRTWVSVSGELDMLTAPELRSVLRACVEDRCSDVVVDLVAVEFLDAQGLSVLLEGRRRLRDRHRHLTIASPSALVRRVLELTGLAETFAVAPASHAAQE